MIYFTDIQDIFFIREERFMYNAIDLLTEEQQRMLIAAMSYNLAALRAKAEVSQSDLSAMLGISRQTYSSMESGLKPITWGTYLSLLLYFDYNSKTHAMLRDLKIFPELLLQAINADGSNPYERNMTFPGVPDEVFKKLDAQAFQSIRTVIMLEYAKCEKISGEAVIRSFDGINFGNIEDNKEAADALTAIREGRKK